MTMNFIKYLFTLCVGGREMLVSSVSVDIRGQLAGADSVLLSCVP